MSNALTVTIVVSGVVLGLLLAVACGKPSAETTRRTTTRSADVTTASCDTIAERGTCNEYRSRASLGLERSLCDGNKGGFSMHACPTSGQIGWCETSGGELKRYYRSTYRSLEEAKDDCGSARLKGRFVPAPAS